MDRRTALLLLSGVFLGGATGLTQPLRFGFSDAFAPYSKKAGENSDDAIGILPDLIREIGVAAHLDIACIAGPWARVQGLVEAGQLDGFCTTRNDARKTYAIFGDTATIQIEVGFWHRQGDDRFSTLESLEPMTRFRVGDYVGNGWAAVHLKHVNLSTAPRMENVLQMLAAGRIDVTLQDPIIVRHLARSLGLETSLAYTPARFLPSIDFQIGLRQSLPGAAEMIALLDRATTEVRARGALERIIRKHV